MKRAVELRISDGSSLLLLRGQVYRRPIHDNDPPVDPAPIDLQLGAVGSVDLDPSSYAYRFDVKVGTGKFTVRAFHKGAFPVPLAEGSFDTADGVTQNLFRFEVMA